MIIYVLLAIACIGLAIAASGAVGLLRDLKVPSPDDRQRVATAPGQVHYGSMIHHDLALDRVWFGQLYQGDGWEEQWVEEQVSPGEAEESGTTFSLILRDSHLMIVDEEGAQELQQLPHTLSELIVAYRRLQSYYHASEEIKNRGVLSELASLVGPTHPERLSRSERSSPAHSFFNTFSD